MSATTLPVLTVGGLVLAVLACAAPAPAPAPPASAAKLAGQSAGGPAATTLPLAAPIPVRVSRTVGLGNTLQIAAARGYYVEQGLEIQYVEFGSSAEAVPPLTTGDLDAGSQAPSASFFNALARGIRLALALDASHVAAGGRGFPLIARLSGGSPSFREAAELRGKRVAFPLRGVIMQVALERVLASVDLGVDDLADVHYMPFPEIMAAFAGGSIEASVLPEPYGTVAEDRGIGFRVLNTDDQIVGAEVALIVFSEKFARERPDAARRFATAYLRGARDFMDAMEHGRDRDAILAILAEAAHIEARVWDKSGYFPIRRDGRINIDGLLAFADWLESHGYVPQKPDIASIVDNQFAEHAARTLDAAR